MIVMKVRYEIGDINLRVNNMSPKDAESYVLLKASDDVGNEISFALSDEQAERLELELFEANRRRRINASTYRSPHDEPVINVSSQTFGSDDQLSLEHT